jgi:dTDP-4-dehydrorhamnose reductase
MVAMAVTGASGLLGANLLFGAAGRWRITAFTHRHTISVPGVECRRLDLTSGSDVERELGRLRPALIVHLAAATGVDWCEAHPAETERLNVEATGTLARWAARNGGKLVFMSTDSVFDGSRGGYAEDDAPGPVNRYAASKLRAEQAVRALAPDHLIVRGNFYGWSAQAKDSLAEWMLRRLEARQPVPGFVDVVFSPLLASTLAELLCAMIAKDAAGTYHVGSADAVSKHEFALAIARVFELDARLVERAALGSAALRARRPQNTSLRTARLRSELGIEPPRIEDDLARFRRLRDSGYAARLRASCAAAQ